MKTENTTRNYNSYYYIPALICGVLTAWVITESVGYTILGAVVGLLSASLWLNLVQKNEEA